MAKQKTLFRETTTVPVSRSVASIMDLLVQAGARSLMSSYDAAGKITGVRFGLQVASAQVWYDLPARTEPVFQMLKKKRAGGRGRFDIKAITEQAERVAWRQLFAWTEAQVAMIQTGMVQPAEVFLPYAVVSASGQTAHQAFIEQGLKMLAAPEAPRG